MKEEPLDEQKPILSENSVLNLIAIGAFLWFFLKSINHLIFDCFKSIAIISGMSAGALFWIGKISSIAIMGIIAVILTRRIWHKYFHNKLNSKSLLIKLGFGVFTAQSIQFIYGFYITEYLYDHFQKSMRAYYDAINNIDQFGLIDVSFSIAGTILLLLVFIKWK